MALVRIGLVARPHGVHGEVALDGNSLTPLELHAVGVFTWRGADGRTLPLTLETARPAHARMLVRFAGYADRDQAAALGGGELLAEEERLPDPGPGMAYTFQLLGASVRTVEGRVLGTLADIVQTGAHPIYVVRGEHELLIPAVPGVVTRVDLSAREVTVALPAGLEEL